MISDEEWAQYGYVRSGKDNLYKKEGVYYIQVEGAMVGASSLPPELIIKHGVAEERAKEVGRKEPESGPELSEDARATLEEYERKEGKGLTPEMARKAVDEVREEALVVLEPPTLQNRGTEERIQSLMEARRLESIMEASKDWCDRNKRKWDGLALGVLYHDLGGRIGEEPSAPLIDMITKDMGNIRAKITHSEWVQVPQHSTDGKEVKIWQGVTAHGEAEDRLTGNVEPGTATEFIDVDAIEERVRRFAKKGTSEEQIQKNVQREIAKEMPFIRRKAERKCIRNAKTRLIPTPKPAMVVLIKNILREYKEKKKGASK